MPPGLRVSEVTLPSASRHWKTTGEPATPTLPGLAEKVFDGGFEDGRDPLAVNGGNLRGAEGLVPKGEIVEGSRPVGLVAAAELKAVHVLPAEVSGEDRRAGGDLGAVAVDLHGSGPAGGVVDKGPVDPGVGGEGGNG